MPGRKETVRGQHVPESGGKEDGGLITANTAESESTPLAEVGFILASFPGLHSTCETRMGKGLVNLWLGLFHILSTPALNHNIP